MIKIIEIINQAIGGNSRIKCLPCERVNLDFDRFEEYEDSNEHKALDIFEFDDNENKAVKSNTKLNDINDSLPPLFTYFLDGSRRTYKVADLLVEGRYLPIIAGQIGVGVLRRSVEENNAVYLPMKNLTRFNKVLALPDKLVSKDDLHHFSEKVNQNGHEVNFLSYNVKEERDPVDLGIAKIMARMHDLELDAIKKLHDHELLKDGSILIKDGPLRYQNSGGKRFDIIQMRNVIGLSKTFRPSVDLKKGNKKVDVGSLTYNLGWKNRTPVFKTYDFQGNNEQIIGMWYLRMRPNERMSNPLQGIVKAECYATSPQEKERGLDTERINTYSRHLLRERNVTPYGRDNRWATHIYPIYLTEKYVKDNMLSDIHFKALF